MDLLEKASVILTPTAYNNGEALCVKPSDGSGDFDFSRNSAATRVNAQGLVENVRSLGSELVTNGDFATDSDWSKGTGWSISGGSANCDGTQTSSTVMVQSSVTNSNTNVKVSFTISGYVSGLIRVRNSGGFAGTYVSGNGTYVFYTNTGIATNIVLDADADFIGSIDNVSVKEVIDNTNLPRINYEGFSYDGSGNIIPNSGCGSWLFESQSTNLITQSETFSDASWTKVEASVSSGFSSPDGLTNAYKLIASVNDSNHRVRSAIIPTAAVGTTVTFSIYIKPQEITKIALVDNWTNLSYGVVNLTTNSVIEEAQGTTSVTEILNGFRRVSFTYQTANINTLPAVYLLDDSYTSGNPTSYTFASDGTSGVYIWGAQLEALSYATSYIPTSGSSVTRNQDVCNNGGSLASINSTEGTLYFEGATLVDGGSNRYISLIGDTHRISILFRGLTGRIRVNGTNFSNIEAQGIPQDNNNKIAVSYSSSGVKLFINGVLEASNTDNPNFPINSLSSLDFDLNGTLPFFGKTKCLAVFPYLTDAELTELTTI